MPFNIKFPKFNPGVSLTSTPFRPTEQVIGDPSNATNLAANSLTPAQMASIINPAPPPVAAAAPRNPFGLNSSAASQNMLNANRWGPGVKNQAPYMDMFGLTGRGGGSSR